MAWRRCVIAAGPFTTLGGLDGPADRPDLCAARRTPPPGVSPTRFAPNLGRVHGAHRRIRAREGGVGGHGQHDYLVSDRSG